MATTTKEKVEMVDITSYIQNKEIDDPEVYRIAAQLAASSSVYETGCTLIKQATSNSLNKDFYTDYLDLLALFFCDNGNKNSYYLEFKPDFIEELLFNKSPIELKLFSTLFSAESFGNFLTFPKQYYEKRYFKNAMLFRKKYWEFRESFMNLYYEVGRDYRVLAFLFMAEILEDELKTIKTSNVKKTIKSPTRATTKRKLTRK